MLNMKECDIHSDVDFSYCKKKFFGRLCVFAVKNILFLQF